MGTRRADLLGATFTLLFGAWVIYQASLLPYKSDYGPGPGFLPLWLGVALCLCGAILLSSSLARGVPDRKWLPDREGARKILLVLGATAAAVAAMYWVGMNVAVGLYLLFLLRAIDRRPWITTVGVAILSPVALYLIFQRWLLVPLPNGPWGF